MRKRKAKKKMSIHKKAMSFVMGSLVLVAFVSYLVQANNMATKGYQISDLENKIEELQQVRKDLESKTMKLQSMSTIYQKVEKLDMVDSESPDVISPKDDKVVRR